MTYQGSTLRNRPEQFDLLKITRECGMVLQLASGASYLQCDPTNFVRNLSDRLSIKSERNIVDLYLEELEKSVLSDSNKFANALQPTVLENDDESNQQDSPMRLWLKVELLQPPLMMRLLEKVCEYSEDPGLSEGLAIDMPTVIIGQFRFLDYIVASRQVCLKIFEIIDIAEEPLQRELISVLPEVLNDQQHEDAALHLKDLLQNKPSLLDCILECLNYLAMSEDIMTDLEDMVLKSLVEVPANMFPTIIKYLLESAKMQSAGRILSVIRKHFDFEIMKAKRQRRNPTEKIDPKLELKVFEALEQGVMRRSYLIDAAWKHLDKFPVNEEFTLFDLWLIFIIQKSQKKKKLVVPLIRKKIRCGSITEVVVEKSFRKAMVSKQLFNQLIELSDILMRSFEDVIVPICGSIYRLCFSTLGESEKQEVVMNLIEHYSSGVEAEVDFALDTIQILLEQHKEEMAQMASYLPPTLDHIQGLSCAQIRKLFHILALLAYSSYVEGTVIRDDLQMCLEKYLNARLIKQKSIGIIGAMKVIEELLCQKSPGPLVYNEVSELMEQLDKQTAQSPITRAQYYDELADIVLMNKVNMDVLEKVVAPILNEFEKHCLLLKGNMESQLKNLPTEYEVCFDLVPTGHKVEDSIYVNILSLCHNDELKDYAVAMCPAFRLLSRCEMKRSGGLDKETLTLFGAPIILCQLNCFTEFSSLDGKKKKLACSSAYHGCNWLREILNSICIAEPNDQAILRLRHLIRLQNLFEKGIEGISLFTVPTTQIDPCGKTEFVLKAQNKAVAKRKAPMANKRKKIQKGNDVTFNEQNGFPNVTKLRQTGNETVADPFEIEQEFSSTSQSAQSQNGTQTVIAASEPTKTFQLDEHYGVFRELDVEVLKMLAIPLNTSADDSDPKALQPKDLEFLLKDLERKLAHSIKSSLKRNTFNNTKTQRGFDRLDQLPEERVREKLFEAICLLNPHLECIGEYYGNILEKSDGITDTEAMYSSISVTLAECLKMLLTSLMTTFSWIGFKKAVNRELLLKLLSVFTKNVINEDSDLEDILTHFLDVILKLEDFAVTVDIAGGILKLLAVIASYGLPESEKNRIASLADRYLKKDWKSIQGEDEKGPKYNEYLQHMLSTRIKFVSPVRRLTALEDFCKNSILEEKELQSETYKTFHKQTSQLFYKAIMAELMSAISIPTPNGGQNELEKWVQATKIFGALLSLLKGKSPSRSNLSVALRSGRQFLDLLVRDCMPELDKVFKQQYEDIDKFLKSVQNATKIISYACAHIQNQKVKDSSLTRYIAPFKKSLEVMVYRVRGMMAFNKCIGAFWIGHLKTKDLQGRVISSQTRPDENDSDNREAEEAGLDDDADVTEDENADDVDMDGESLADSSVSGVTDPDDMSEAY